MITEKILVLDGEQRSALAVTRSLGRAGLEIIIGSELKSSLSGVSKYCKKQVRYPSPFDYPKRFINTINEIIIKEGIKNILPITDISTSVALSYKSILAGDINILSESFENYTFASDKVKLFKMALKIGVPVPDSIVVENKDDLKKLINLKFPLILKPQSSIIVNRGKFYKFGVRFVNSYAEIIDIINKTIAFTQPFLIQELIEGEGVGVFALFKNGKPVAISSHRRIREKPPWGGVSVLCESTEPDEKAKEYAIRILSQLGWNGVAMVEFKRDNNKGGIPILMEINARFWGSLQLSIDSGIDFPLFLYLQSKGENVSTKYIKYSPSRLRWLLGDIDNLYTTLTNKRCISNISYKLESIKNFFKEFRMDSKLQVYRKEDVKPFLWEITQYIKDMLKK